MSSEVNGDLAISARDLSKEYELGLSGRTRSFASIIGDRLRHPVHGGGHARERFMALDGVSFDVARGEAVGVIGKNGAGKSTLLKILSRITPPSRGWIDLSGTVGCLLEVGTGFHPELTGTENVYLNGTILGMSRQEIDARFAEIVEFAEIDAFLDTPVKRYSSGMRVRLAFSVAAHLDPEVLIIDEVLSVGDYAFQAKCLDKMRAVASEEGRTVLYVTHNLVNLEHLCSRAIVLADGSLVFDGPSGEAIAHYLRMAPRADRGELPGVEDLTGDRGSRGHREEVFTRVELRPEGGHPSDTVRMGDRLNVEIAVQGLDAYPDANLHVTVGTSDVQCVFRMTCRMAPLVAAQGRHSRERVVLDIPALNLMPGEYHLDLGVHDRRANLLDEVPRAAQFTVVPADVLGNGYQFTHKDGFTSVPWEWEVRPAVAPTATTPARTTTTRRQS